MDLRSGLPLHLIQNGLPYTYPKLSGDTHADVAIVGAGITGALVACALVKAGQSVIVLEQRSVAAASTSASTALLQYEIDTPLHVLREQVGYAAADRSYLLCAKAVTDLLGIAQELNLPEAIPRKSLQYASHRRHVDDLKRELELRQAIGLPVEWMDPATLKERFGFRKSGALFSACGAEIDPYAFAHALFQYVIARGGRVFDRTEVKKHVREKDGSYLLRTADGQRITARHLVMATGYASQDLLPKSVIDLVSTYAVASQRIDMDELWSEDCLIWETADPYLYLRTTPDRRVIVGGLDVPFKNPKRRDALMPRKTRQLTRAFKKLFPKIPFEPEYSWCGTFGKTKDGLPYIDQDPRDGTWFVLGMGGNGITFSQVGAAIVRDAVLGQTNPDRALFRWDR